MHLLGLTPLPPPLPPATLVRFLVQENPAHPPLGPALAGGETLPAVAFTSSRSSLLCMPACSTRFTASCQLLFQLEHWSATSQEAVVKAEEASRRGRHP